MKENRVNIVISMVVCGCGHIMQPDHEGYTCFNAACEYRGHSVKVRVSVDSNPSVQS